MNPYGCFAPKRSGVPILLLAGAALVFIIHSARNDRGRPNASAAPSTSNAHGTPSWHIKARSDHPINGSSDPVIDRLATLIRKWRLANETGAKTRIESEIEALLTSDNAARFLDLFTPDDLTGSLALKAVALWAENKPGEAMKWLGAHPFPRNPALLDTIVAEWLKKAPLALNAYADTLAPGPWKREVVEASCLHSLEHNLPENAADYLRRLPADDIDPELMEWVASSWGAKDLGATISWIGEQPDPESRDRLLANMLGGRAWHAPLDALATAQTLFPAGPARDHATERILVAWLQTDPTKAAEWAAQSTESESRKSTLDYVLATWLTQDPEQAQRWAESRPAGPDRDAALGRVMQWALESNPEKGVELLPALPERMRENLGRSVILQWARWDFTKASTWAYRLPVGPLRHQALSVLSSVATEAPGNVF